MDRSTRAKIDSMLYEVRAWPEGQAIADVDELARRFRLDPMIVARILEAEGMEVEETAEIDPEPKPKPGSGRRVTSVINLAELDRARLRASGDDDSE